jgi:hypothetical protein
VILRPGLEYIWDNRLRAWVVLERERTELDEIEEWSRIEAGIEYAPGALFF